ncbi:MAG: polysaccharide biosynthesis protein [Terracidiphilus sp.]
MKCAKSRHDLPAIYTSAVTKYPHQLNWHAFLGRPTLPSMSTEDLDALAQMPTLITGAGGSIGSALALRLAHFSPPRLALLESSESNLIQLQQAWPGQVKTRAGASVAPGFFFGDAGDRAILEEIFALHRPRIVFHAAACKHVPLLEQQPFAAIANNIFVTAALAAVAAEYGARVVLLSTDKAAQPASILGVTKRIAEEIVLAAAGTVLRLCNVLTSSGSVTEIFARQIASGGPLTATDPAARRYFLTMDEAVDLLLTAAHTDSSVLLAPALPADHRIADLASFMARELAPGSEIPIRFTGLRRGDKLTEQLWDNDEQACPATSCSGLLSIQPVRPEPAQFKSALTALHYALRERDLAAALGLLRALVPGYRPSEAVLALAQNDPRRIQV